MLRWLVGRWGTRGLAASAALLMTMFWGASAGAVPIVVNGSFEDGPSVGAYSTFDNGDADIVGWTITGHSVDVVGSIWTASDGDQSIDLNGTKAGGLSQTIATAPGMDYTLTFDLAANPAGPNDVYEMQVTAGSVVETFGFDNSSSTFADPGWVTIEVAFTATGSQTLLAFESLRANGGYGPALDNVAVAEAFAIPEPSTAMLALAGLTGLAGLGRRR